MSSHTEDLWYNETDCLWMIIYIYIEREREKERERKGRYFCKIGQDDEK